MGATAWCRDAATDWSPDATTVIAPLRWLVPRPIARPVLAQQPDVVDHRWSLRHWHDRAAGRDLPLYRTPGFAQWHHRAVAHTKHLLGSPNSFGGRDTDACGALDVTHCSAHGAERRNLSVAGINVSRTIACNDSSVSVSGVSNTVVITGHCASLSVSGVQNKVTVQAADSIHASGFNNEITYLAGSPHIDQSGQGNAIQKG